MTKQTTSENRTANSTCRLCGHDWQTIANNYRMCKRHRCRASERLVDGQWVSNATAYRTHTPVVASGHRPCPSQQSRMWDASASHAQRRKDA